MIKACIFNYSQIGELVNKIDKGYASEHYEIPWFKMRGLRNRIVHDYEGVNLNLICEIIDTDIEVLKEQLSKLNYLASFYIGERRLYALIKTRNNKRITFSYGEYCNNTY